MAFRRRCLQLLTCAFVLASLACALTLSSPAATSSLIVGMSTTSATTLDTTGCDSGAGNDGVMALGTLLPGSGVRSPDCVLNFGSSNDATALRIMQPDGVGPAMSSASPGTLDGGYLTAGVSRATIAGDDTTHAATLQRDGKLVAATNSNGSMYVIRRNANGSLDTAFDGNSGVGNGIVNISSLSPNANLARTVSEDPAGRLLVMVATYNWFTPDGMHVVRLLSDGRVDTSWGGGDGIVDINPTVNSDEAWNAIVGPDGSIYFLGFSSVGYKSCITGDQQLIVKLRSDGNYDTSFSGDGVATFDFGASVDCAMDAEVDASGRLVVSGIRDTEAIIYRLSVAGALDTAGFNSPSGYRLLNPGAASEGGRAVSVSRTGNILLAMNGGNVDWYVARLRSDGSMDPAFGTAGTATIDFGSATNDGGPWDMLELSDGRIMVTGERTGGALPSWFTTIRLTAAGAFDTTFSTDGWDSQDLSPGTTGESGTKLVAAQNGGVLAVGNSNPTAADVESTVVAYVAGGTIPDYIDNGTADWDTMPEKSMFGVCMKSSTAATSWTINAGCPMTDGLYWRGVSAAPSTVSSLAAAGAGTSTLVFGVRSSMSQTPAAYQAPVLFDVTAPGL